MRRALPLSLLALSAALAGCGGGSSTPHLARADAAPLIALAGRISSEGPCDQARDIDRLQRRALRLVQERRVPAALEEHFLSGVNALAAESPPCLPVVPPAPATSTAPPAAKPVPQGHGHGPRPGEAHGHGHGHGHGHDDGEGDGG